MRIPISVQLALLVLLTSLVGLTVISIATVSRFALDAARSGPRKSLTSCYSG